MDNLRIYSRILCPIEIQNVYNGGEPFDGVKIISGRESSNRLPWHALAQQAAYIFLSFVHHALSGRAAWECVVIT